jgi:hypothetical protein
MVLEGDDFGGAHKGKIGGIKEEKDLLPPDILIQGKMLYKFATVHDGVSTERGCFFPN